ncbi:hemerythrin domain-containing protein [Intrasporangium calvum]|uniref:Hemerythrin domain-containing protein n=1 Tax=Intrasporangium calvum TaxID=53358 RepID=A0ABT5GM37_9MICO|nr:SRPBCC family protein [Intrasporangium calvum]MDC5699308.1 hemerythrin domain-containing protein [Intrasporangium calvum]
MTTKVEKSVEVDVPVRTAYNQWTQFEEFPDFMGGVESVTQRDDRTLHWVAAIAGVRREWDAEILEQVPDEKVAWAATSGATNAGAVHFIPNGPGQTLVTLHLEFEPEGLVEKAGDALNVVERQTEADLANFKSFIESRGAETGAWRGEVRAGSALGTPGVADTVPPGQDVVDVLTADHREVAGLIGEIWTTQDPGERRDLADTAIAELVRHAVAEEMYVYPAMRKHLADGDEAVEHDVEEHQQLEELMKQFEGVEGSDPRFNELLRKLDTVLADHISDEETKHFPQLRAALPESELVELAGKVESAKKLAPTRPHPAAPNHELFHKLVGPGVGMVDRLRDKLTGRTTS